MTAETTLAIEHLTKARDLDSPSGTVVVSQMALFEVIQELHRLDGVITELQERNSELRQVVTDQGDVITELTGRLEALTAYADGVYTPEPGHAGTMRFPASFNEVWRAQAEADEVSPSEFMIKLAERFGVDQLDVVGDDGSILLSSRTVRPLPEPIPDIAGRDVTGAFTRRST